MFSNSKFIFSFCPMWSWVSFFWIRVIQTMVDAKLGKFGWSVAGVCHQDVAFPWSGLYLSGCICTLLNWDKVRTGTSDRSLLHYAALGYLSFVSCPIPCIPCPILFSTEYCLRAIWLGLDNLFMTLFPTMDSYKFLLAKGQQFSLMSWTVHHQLVFSGLLLNVDILFSDLVHS